jgi:hypothetical protein
MGCVPPRFGINVITKGRIGDDELVVVVFFLMDGRGGGRRGVFVLIGVLSGFINLKPRLDFDFYSSRFFILILRLSAVWQFSSCFEI